jgi:hypothetical protein
MPGRSTATILLAMMLGNRMPAAGLRMESGIVTSGVHSSQYGIEQNDGGVCGGVNEVVCVVLG